MANNASTVTTLMVFLPLLVWPGIVGSFMISSDNCDVCVISITFHGSNFHPVLGGKMGKVNSFKETWRKGLALEYRNILKLALHYPIMVVISVAASMVVAFGGYFSAGLGVSFPRNRARTSRSTGSSSR